jgi:HlyD family secretion protein
VNNATLRRAVIWGALGVALIVGLVFAFRPRPVPVDLIELARGPLVVTVDEEGETRVRDIFVLSAPVSGRALRIEAEAGDPVVANTTVVAEVEPIDPEFLDTRTEAQAQADLRAAESAEALSQAELAEAQAEFDFARTELDRARALVADGTISQRDLDDAERLHETRKAAVQTALAALQVRRFELERAKAQLLSPADARDRARDCQCVPLISPVDGCVLRVLHESEGVVQAGTPLVDIGDPRDLEIVSDLLSAEAVKVVPGQRVIIEDWGGDSPLAGRVRRVEPFGFTKISALGIEEQRVNVVIDFTSPAADWARLGHGYQVEVRIVLWEGDDLLTVPLTALFREGDDWAVFVKEHGRAQLRMVTVGQRTGLEAEIVEGLEVGDEVVIHPSERVEQGVRITSRS